MLHDRIYLDNAATSWPKPDEVYRAVDDYLRHGGGAAGRGHYQAAIDAERIVTDARYQVASVLGTARRKSIVFGLNGTDALNMVLHGWLREGDHVVTTQAEHNSVLRPLAALAHQGVQATYVACAADGTLNLNDVQQAFRPATRLLVVTHASNVTGTLMPAAELAALAHQHGVPILLDAAQTAGYVPIDIDGWEIDFLATPGHKGLLGPLGTGVMYVAEQHVEQLAPLRQGGTGTRSHLPEQPDDLPDKYESGNLNVPGLAGLAAGAAWVNQHGVEVARQASLSRLGQLLDGLRGVDRLRLYGVERPDARVGVVSISIDGYSPQELATLLDAQWQIAVRGGLHCAPKMHEALGTLAAGGTLRVSLGHFTTADQIDTFLEAVRELAAAAIT